MTILDVAVEKPEEINFILGQTHFIKTVEDLNELIVTSIPGGKFGLAFNEASGPCLVRFAGNDDELVDLAVRNLKTIGAGHTFIIFMRNFYPINILNGVKNCPEVARIFCATSNPVTVVVAENPQGRGILGVIDGSSPMGIETAQDIQKRQSFLRMIGYKA
ncbi:MAG: adenosine-specific kinase [Candidatus Delongbacteria bacterium]|nr:adenosine-specific kinase [Candidatus Delongbacteria bacterium]